MHTDNTSTPGITLLLYLTCGFSKLLSITINPDNSMATFTNWVCLVCAVLGAYFAWKNYLRNRRIDREKKNHHEKSKRKYP